MSTQTLERTRRKILSFLRAYGSAHLDLACHAAFPFAVTPDLLYCLRENFLPDAPYVAVADVLLSPWCDSVGDELYEIEPEVRAFLLQQLAEDYRFGEARLNQLAEFAAAYVEAKLPENPRAERDLGGCLDFEWLALACLPRGEASQRLRQRLRQAVAAGNDAERQRWIELLEEQRDVLGELGLEPALLSRAGTESITVFPPLETFEFEEGYFEAAAGGEEDEDETTPEDPELQPFEFETAQISIGIEVPTKLPKGFEPLIQRRSGRALQFVETLPGDVSLEMVAVPGGKFRMGAAEREKNALKSEYPQHEVTVADFFLGKYPVTQAQWRAVAQQLPQVERELDLDPSFFKGDNRPVEQVSWYDAMEFCARLARVTGRSYHLPSEAEWEYACRAGTITPFAFGETLTPELANYDGNYTYGRGVKGVDREETTEVGSFLANVFGLYDMHGNVYEWCLDVWHDNYEGAPSDGSAWLNDETNENLIEKLRLLRGGSWYNYPWYCRCAYRIGFVPGDRYFINGFRVCCAGLRTT